MSDEFKKLTDELQVAVNEIRDTQATLEKTKISKESLDKEIQPMLDKVTTKMNEMEAGLKKKTDQIEVELTRIKDSVHDGKDGETPQQKAFLRFLRVGDKGLGPEELKVLKISDDTSAGYLATPELSADILKTQMEYSPIRSIATVRTIGRESYEVRTRSNQFSANWVGELGARNETTGLAFGIERIPVHELAARVDVSRWSLEDSDYDLESFIAQEFGERFGVAEGTSFVSGNTTYQPEGILTNANVANVSGGNDTALNADGFFTLYYAPKSAYTRNAKWIMRRATMAAASKLKDSQNNYLLTRLGESPAWVILGSEVVECPDMPAVANAVYPVAFGDFKRAYLIVDRVGISILRDPYTAANTGTVILHAHKRVGGKIVMAEAIYKMLIKA